MTQRLDARHEFPAPARVVADAMADPGFHQSLRLPDVGEPTVVRHEHSATEALVAVRFEFSGGLDPLARRVLGAQQVAWVQTLRIDLRNLEATLDVVPEVSLGGQVTCRARCVLHDTATGSVRTLDGSLQVRVPLIGGRAERALAPGILRRIDLEADALARHVAD